jgi:transcriptional antiterminator NusG
VRIDLVVEQFLEEFQRQIPVRHSLDLVEELIRGMKHVRSRVQGVVEYSEVDRYLQVKPVVEGLAVGALVEIIAGPFKGMQAKVINVDKVKEEVTIEILEAAFTLPITVHADYVRPTKGGD